jgi:hypothetical protein
MNRARKIGIVYSTAQIPALNVFDLRWATAMVTT